MSAYENDSEMGEAVTNLDAAEKCTPSTSVAIY
jgi:hypothetical protein